MRARAALSHDIRRLRPILKDTIQRLEACADGGTGGAGIIALDKATGAVRWKHGNDEAGYSSPIAATIGGKRYALVFTRAGLSAVNPTNGAGCFDFPWRSSNFASVNAATPVISGGLIFLTASYGTGAALLRVENGGAQKVWSGDEALSCHYATPVLDKGYLYGIDGRAEFTCLEPGQKERLVNRRSLCIRGCGCIGFGDCARPGLANLAGRSIRRARFGQKERTDGGEQQQSRHAENDA